MVRSIMMLAAFSISLSNVAFSDAWTDAKELFDRRGEGRAVVAQARAAYEVLASRSEGDALILAVSQISRLDLYEGEMILPKSAKAERKSIFGHCWKNSVTRIDPSVVGENPAYYYWRGVCLGFWGKPQGPWHLCLASRSC